MLDTKNLSKIKYIYRIYSADDMLHLERYPVVYINSEIVYYKAARKNSLLNYEYLNSVLDKHTRIEKPHSYYCRYTVPWIDKYFWGIETDIQEIFEDLKTQYTTALEERLTYLNKTDEDNKRARLEIAKREYEAALREIELLDSLKENKEN